MKYIKEYAFWNKDSITAEKILKNLDDLKSSDIIKDDESSVSVVKYSFTMKDFNISVEYDCDLFDFLRPVGYYVVKVDGVKLDVSWNQGRKIYNKAKKIYEIDDQLRQSLSAEEDEYIKKDAKISL